MLDEMASYLYSIVLERPLRWGRGWEIALLRKVVRAERQRDDLFEPAKQQSLKPLVRDNKKTFLLDRLNTSYIMREKTGRKAPKEKSSDTFRHSVNSQD